MYERENSREINVFTPCVIYDKVIEENIPLMTLDTYDYETNLCNQMLEDIFEQFKNIREVINVENVEKFLPKKLETCEFPNPLHCKKFLKLNSNSPSFFKNYPAFELTKKKEVGNNFVLYTPVFHPGYLVMTKRDYIVIHLLHKVMLLFIRLADINLKRLRCHDVLAYSRLVQILCTITLENVETTESLFYVASCLASTAGCYIGAYTHVNCPCDKIMDGVSKKYIDAVEMLIMMETDRMRTTEGGAGYFDCSIKGVFLNTFNHVYGKGASQNYEYKVASWGISIMEIETDRLYKSLRRYSAIDGRGLDDSLCKPLIKCFETVKNYDSILGASALITLAKAYAFRSATEDSIKRETNRGAAKTTLRNLRDYIGVTSEPELLTLLKAATIEMAIVDTRYILSTANSSTNEKKDKLLLFFEMAWNDEIHAQFVDALTVDKLKGLACIAYLHLVAFTAHVQMSRDQPEKHFVGQVYDCLLTASRVFRNPKVVNFCQFALEHIAATLRHFYKGPHQEYHRRSMRIERCRITIGSYIIGVIQLVLPDEASVGRHTDDAVLAELGTKDVVPSIIERKTEHVDYEEVTAWFLQKTEELNIKSKIEELERSFAKGNHGSEDIKYSQTVTTGGGSAVTTGGASAVTTGGASAVATGGASAVTTGGASAVTTGGASAVTTGGASAVTTGGASAVTTGGASTDTTGGAPAVTTDDAQPPYALYRDVVDEGAESESSFQATENDLASRLRKKILQRVCRSVEDFEQSYKHLQQNTIDHFADLGNDIVRRRLRVSIQFQAGTPMANIFKNFEDSKTLIDVITKLKAKKSEALDLTTYSESATIFRSMNILPNIVEALVNRRWPVKF